VPFCLSKDLLYKNIRVKTIWLYILCFFFTSNFEPAMCQLSTGYFRLMRTSWQVDKRSIVDELMQFNEKEANAFWPVYDKHMKKWGSLMEYRITIIQEYCNEFAMMKGKDMSKYINALVKNDIELTQLQKKFFTRVRKVLPPARASQLMEIEYELQLVLLSEMQQRTPVVGDHLKKL
jgi:hypothetical protein